MRRGSVTSLSLKAMAAVPRHVNVEGRPWPPVLTRTQRCRWAWGKTISRPYVVARMIELLPNGRQSLGKTLEIGAGCGYQAAVLAQLTNEVYAVERLAPLLEKPDQHAHPAAIQCSPQTCRRPVWFARGWAV
ncbi:MAG: hypothetical protein IPF44_17370 [Betaproteobacteria bacterium]|nr:hypothetical protein [Betaproteobacteria bacterium]